MARAASDSSEATQLSVGLADRAITLRSGPPLLKRAVLSHVFGQLARALVLNKIPFDLLLLLLGTDPLVERRPGGNKIFLTKLFHAAPHSARKDKLRHI